MLLATWNPRSLLGGLWSKASRVSAKRAEFTRLLGQCDVLCLQEVRVTLDDLLLRDSHRYFGMFGEFGDEEASSRWDGVAVAILKRVVASAFGVRSEAVWRGRIVQVDLTFAQAALRIISLHIDPIWSRDDVRAAFAELCRRSYDTWR